MSISLTLYLYDDPESISGSISIPWAQIEFPQDYRVFVQFRGHEDLDHRPADSGPIRPEPIPPAFWFEDRDEDDRPLLTREDSWGDPLTFVYAEQFKKLKFDPDEVAPQTKAIVTFLKNVPPDTPVLLYWH